MYKKGGLALEYITVKEQGEDFFIEKKSKFIGHCKPVKTESEALEFISEIKSKHADANHNVYAYILRENGTQRFSDDSEPQGTAGIPVIDALKKANIVDVVVVATRYFGGTLLGGGGLIRAYSHTASIAVEAAKKIVMRECLILKVVCDYTFYGKVSSAIPEFDGVVEDTEFLENVSISFHIDEGNLESLKRKFADITNGTFKLEILGKDFFEFF